MSVFRRLIGKFKCDKRGSVSIIFAFATTALVATVGAAVNISQATNARVSLQGALDAATLAAAQELSKGQTKDELIRTLGEEVFEASIEAGSEFFTKEPVPVFEIDRDESLVTSTVEATVEYQFKFFDALESVTIGADAEAQFGTLNIELAMALDLTGSMRGGKIRDLQSAAKGVVTTLLTENPTATLDKTVRISLVPYSAAVNTGDLTKDITGVANPTSNCVVERSGALQTSDSSAKTNPIPQHPAAYCPQSEVTPLNSEHSELIAEIDDFRTGGCTAGHLGIAWAYYTLSPHWANVWPVESQPALYSDHETMKVALIMTDGVFNTYYSAGGDPTCSWSAQQKSNQLARKLCRKMRDDGIVVYSVAFKAPSQAEALLRNCADSADRYFETDSGAELVAAFDVIASEVQSLRLTQ